MTKVILFWVMTTLSGDGISTQAGTAEFPTADQCMTAKAMILDHAKTLSRAGVSAQADCL
ncbi:hypothetical protein KASHIRA_01130 [Serratia phage vB_SmaM-Kashira]|nr:hypothetical protein [Acinetobacter phage ABPH49]URC22687.1 hypothetical protein KASHIRA_01130 [Serratia phage vB_SmaM-Kashira]